MPRRLPHLPAWQWRGIHARHPGNWVMQLIAVPIFIVSALLALYSLLKLDFGDLAIGLIGIAAALGLRRQGHRLER